MSRKPVYEYLSGSIHIVTLFGSRIRMTPILQRGASIPLPFSYTVEESQEKGGFDVCINGQWYGLNLGTTGNEGIAVLGTGERYGNSSPGLWSISQKNNYEWIVNEGEPPSNIYTGVGGLCPLIINGLKYGESNTYSKKLIQPKLIGKPKEHHKKFLLQRSSAKFTGLLKTSNKGKCGFGVKKDGSVIIVVEQDDKASLTYYQFRDIFIKRGCIHALACDGSDSVFLYYDKKWKVSAGFGKNNTQTSGIGFRIDG